MIGFVGLGIMGFPMAENLIKAGFTLMVNDLDRHKVKSLVEKGATFADYETIAQACSTILLILPNGKISREVLFGRSGLAKKLKAGSIVCDMSSVTPNDSKECKKGLDALGITFVDAPVSGGEPKAIEGSLSFMVGAEEKDFDRLMPLFKAMGSSAVRVGPVGSGSVTKLANQIIVNNNIAALAEALVFAVKAGADPNKVYEAIKGGLAGSAVMDAKTPMMIRGDYRPGGKISINHKDIKNVLSAAHELDVPVPMSAQLFEIMQALKVKGHFHEDHSAIVTYFEDLAACKVSQGVKDECHCRHEERREK